MQSIVSNPVRLFACCAVMVLSIAASCYAAEDTGMKPCADDISKFCADVKPGGGRVVECLKGHDNELSEGCREKMSEIRQKIMNINKACQDDVSKFCKDVKPGGRRVIECLREHAPELSAECKEALPQRRK